MGAARGEEAAGRQAIEGLVDGQGVGPGQERALVVGPGNAAADRVEGREGVLDQADDRPAEPFTELAQGRLQGRRQGRGALGVGGGELEGGRVRAAEADQAAPSGQAGEPGEPAAGGVVALGEPDEGAPERGRGQALEA